MRLTWACVAAIFGLNCAAFAHNGLVSNAIGSGLGIALSVMGFYGAHQRRDLDRIHRRQMAMLENANQLLLDRVNRMRREPR